MPPIQIKHIVSFSSEDKVHKAENLIKPETYRKWKCASPGENQASVVVQFEKASEICSIDIGNEGSAFVEILVQRSSDPSQEFQVLLVASSFMTPLESRQGTNLNRVRMFGPEKLSLCTSNQKWDIAKIVCTQPFNKNTQFGISFIKFHSPPDLATTSEDEVSGELQIQPKKIGAFMLKPSETSENDLSVGSWFAKRKEKKEPDPETGPAAIREASSLAAAVPSPSASNSSSYKPSKQKNTGRGGNGASPSEFIKQKLLASTKQSSAEKYNRESYTKEKTTSSPRPSEQKCTGKESRKNIVKRKRKQSAENEETPSNKVQREAKGFHKVKEGPFNQLMKKVVFVLSGFQNPFRSELRDKACAMGARYKGDWNDSCTHLVCAFVNTPKYTQVLSKGGRIVTKHWILDCHKKSKLLPWRDYKLGNYSKENTTEEDSGSEEDKNTIVQKNLVDKYDKGSDVESVDTEVDTEDEIKRVQEGKDTESIYEEDTDIDEDGGLEDIKPDTSHLPLPHIPDFFKNKVFFLYGEFSTEERRILLRYIKGHCGSIEEYMSDNVQYVVTLAQWDKNFDEALEENSNLVFVRPRWIYLCNEKGKMMPYQPYVVAPNLG
ncbi:DNA repair protein XRCC1-like [Limulus polyphemus]|uniref:DNA repair protein XRCC1-like n=1 Tax=Limulus polyphemus TaxID=6850 RepID=A0ABM1S5W5_LIMPO|nr:DNA repair protein XRCC1-like [Limulus polyphemus]XP_022239020.1 DNA repair protein XRCC1-like [Limulus polyphemus]